MKTLFKFFGGIVALLIVIGFLLPSKWQVERSIDISAPPERILPLISNLKLGWPQWSAFDNEDPTIEYAFPGLVEGVGAERTWKSKKMGDGFQKILKADAAGIESDLNMPATSFLIHIKFKFEPTENGTKVIWTDYGDVGMHLVSRYFILTIESMLAPKFEQSLQKLKALAEI